LSGFNPASAGAGITVPSIATFVSGFYNGGHASYYASGLAKLCHKCVTDACKRLTLHFCFSFLWHLIVKKRTC